MPVTPGDGHPVLILEGERATEAAVAAYDDQAFHAIGPHLFRRGPPNRPASRNSGQREVPMIVPPRWMMFPTARSSSSMN